MKITRVYTKTGRSPYEGIEFENRSSHLDGKEGQVLYHQELLTFPTGWSQIASDIVAQKYFRRRDVNHAHPNSLYNSKYSKKWAASLTTGPFSATYEFDIRQVIHRMVGCWTAWGEEYGYFHTKKDAQAFYDEMSYMLAQQMFAPNSPQWFNTGLFWAYGIEGVAQGHFYVDDETGQLHQSTNAYEHPQPHACFILSVKDDLVNEGGIFDLFTREARIFKLGSGAGSNYSALRGEGEPLSGGGRSSGLMSFLAVGDQGAGAIKSGGTCLSAHQRVYTNLGPMKVKELADSGKEFITLSFDPANSRYMAKRATARFDGRKRTVTVRTDKGQFSLSFHHPFRLPDGSAVRAENLRAGMSLMACKVDTQHGHLRVGLRDGKKGKEFLHRLIATDVLGWDVAGLSVHHADENRLNNDPANLRLMHQSEHAHHHGITLAEAGAHVFQTRAFPKAGVANGMHATSEFWSNEDKVSAYRKKQGDILARSGRANDMQRESTIQRMLNLGYQLINGGAEIPTFEAYVKSRKSMIGRIYSISKLKRTMDKYFGGYDGYLRALAANNHRVVEVIPGAIEEVYDVEVVCTSASDESPSSGHNFVIWSGDSPTGSGVVVFSPRREAKDQPASNSGEYPHLLWAA